MGDDYAIPASLLRHFDLAALPYGSTSHDIEARRRASPDGKLFYDRLLKFASLDGPSLYPPSSPSAFRRLLHAIHTSPIDRLKRDCFVYYLVRDGDAQPEMDVDDAESSSSASSSRAHAFARARCLPRTWQTLIDGYWLLDNGRYEEGVAALRDPGLPAVDFVPSIVEALTTNVSPPARALSFVYAFLLSPDRTQQDGDKVENDAALLASASVAGMSAAFRRIRALSSPEDRERARDAVWCWSLGAPRTPAGKAPHTAQPRALRELLHLALTDEEADHLVQFLANPPREIQPPARSLLHDLVTLRLVHAGSYAETLALDKQLAASDAASASDRQRRREMVREFIDILPEAQRRALLAGSDAPAAREPARAVPNGTSSTADVDMDSDWVSVATPTPVAPSTPAPRVVAPTPIRAPAIASIQADSGAGSSTPARPSSPFAGPPRFAAASPRPASPPKRARTPEPAPTVAATLPVEIRQTSPVRASHIASPFQPPPSASSRPARQPKQPKRMIIDEEPAKVAPTPRRQTRPPRRFDEEDSNAAASSRQTSEPPVEATPSTRRTRRSTVTKADDATPKAPAPKRRSARASSRASTVEIEPDMPPPAIPGGFYTVPENEPVDVPPTPARNTRSASQVPMEEDEAPKKRGKASALPKRSTRAASEVTDDGNGPAPRRSTRTRGGAASELGSPTPSIASTVDASSPTKPKRTTRTTTTRATRSRK
ncbi:hypothetical protein Q8F55_006227 [Vanrija albida]|uniref:ELYS-like domain-containing protein n=1 Tax=Vanrija albida TaxID=181172 RepID=A0ABR3PXF9_9TREE